MKKIIEPEGVSKSRIDELGLCHQQEYADYQPLFFAETALERRPARNLCQVGDGCPVRLECLRWALENKEIWGIWGGCDESELRRALWVNSDGKPSPRSRFPHCPACHRRPSNLFITAVCELGTGRRRERVECFACGFYWCAQTSIVAVKAYWRGRKKQLRAKATASRRRLPKEQVAETSAQKLSECSTLPEEKENYALAASAAPR